MGQTDEKQQKTAVHGRPAGMHGRAPVAEATHDHAGTHSRMYATTHGCAPSRAGRAWLLPLVHGRAFLQVGRSLLFSAVFRRFVPSSLLFATFA